MDETVVVRVVVKLVPKARKRTLGAGLACQRLAEIEGQAYECRSIPW